MKKPLIPNESIISRIFLIRDKKVMLGRDLAEPYGVKTMVLNQAVKRNLKRFPSRFYVSVIQRRGQRSPKITNCDLRKRAAF